MVYNPLSTPTTQETDPPVRPHCKACHLETLQQGGVHCQGPDQGDKSDLDPGGHRIDPETEEEDLEETDISSPQNWWAKI